MDKNVKEIHAANARYVEGFGDKGSLSHHPARNIAIVTCMDCRLDPAKFAGLAKGDAHVIRNAGGRVTDDVIRSLLISYKMLGTKEWFIIQHTHCGMMGFTENACAHISLKFAPRCTAMPDTLPFKIMALASGSTVIATS